METEHAQAAAGEVAAEVAIVSWADPATARAAVLAAGSGGNTRSQGTPRGRSGWIGAARRTSPHRWARRRRSCSHGSAHPGSERPRSPRSTTVRTWSPPLLHRCHLLPPARLRPWARRHEGQRTSARGATSRRSRSRHSGGLGSAMTSTRRHTTRRTWPLAAAAVVPSAPLAQQESCEESSRPGRATAPHGPQAQRTPRQRTLPRACPRGEGWGMVAIAIAPHLQGGDRDANTHATRR